MPLSVQRSFDDLGAPLWEVPFCVLDLETTGGSPRDCEITEIGAVRYIGGEEQGRFQTLVNPGAAIPPYITILTGITEAMVVEAPRIEEALPAFLEFLGEAVIVGHNTRFDLSFLNTAAARLGYGKLPNRWTDTAALARRLCRNEVRNLKLATLAAHFRSPTTPTHRALEDAVATAHVFFQLLERAGTLGVTHLDDLLQLRTAKGSPHYRKIGLADRLPRRPGVYLMKDRTGAVMYVGKAKNLRTRVRSYFYGDERRRVATLMRELADIDYRVCSSELEAEITELRLIQAHRPRHNRRSKPPRSSHWVKLTSERFPRLSVVRSCERAALAYLGPFRSKRSADQVVEALWDAVPIRRCTGNGTKRSRHCSFGELGVALDPCGGEVSPEEYHKVVARLLAGLDQDPDLLLSPLAGRMASLAAEERFEEAAWARDRHQALATALEARRQWTALTTAGTVRAETEDGEGIVVAAGRLAAAWGPGTPPPLIPAAAGPAEVPPVPRTVAVADEARLVWRWLMGSGARLVDSTGGLALPLRPVERLERRG